MRKGSRERIEKGSRESREKKERKFEKKEGLRNPPPFLEFSRSDPAMQPLFLQVLRV